MSRRRIDLSCDLGEARSPEELAVEDEIWPLISAANVACGGHVGDERSMLASIERCLAHGITLGAHPSYPDREGFGRRHIEIATVDLVASLSGQIEALCSLGRKRGLDVVRVKPHGMLYNEAQADARLAEAVAAAVRQSAPAAALVCAGGSEVERACASAGLAVVREAFVDRRYLPSGALQPRSEPGSMLIDPDEAAAQALRLARDDQVIACDGTTVAVEFETLCAHSDMPGSVERIRLVRARLAGAGFVVG